MPDLTLLPEGDLARFVTRQPWFRSRVGETVPARIAEAAVLEGTSPLLALALVEIGVQNGGSELYQLPLGLRPAAEARRGGAIAEVDGWVAYDALADPELHDALVRHLTGGGVIRTADAAAVEYVATNVSTTPPEPGRQSFVLKAYRRLEAGTHPELELLRFLNDRGFANAPVLGGWYSYASRLICATLGVVHVRIDAAADGWTFARESLTEDPQLFLAEAGRLGAVVGAMHAVLASERGDPDFAPEEPSAEALALLGATLDEEVGSLFATLPDDDALAPIAGCCEEVRENLRLLSRLGVAGRVIRLHGNLHLGTVVRAGGDWLLLDFGGETERTIAERRRKQSPLRDVASMLRSFAYVVSAATLDGADPPRDWEEQARAEFLAGYFGEIEPTGLIPGGMAASEKLLTLFELERAVHELRFELEHRPEWVPIPVAAVARLLELQVATVS